jgi:hypothetical protein
VCSAQALGCEGGKAGVVEYELDVRREAVAAGEVFDARE